MRTILDRLRQQPIGEAVRDSRVEIHRDRQRELVQRALRGQQVYDELERAAQALARAGADPAEGGSTKRRTA